MAPEMLGGFLMASMTRRAWRRRSIASGPTLFLEIKVGNDLEIYEPEVVRFAKEEVEEINLFYDFYGVLDEEDYDWLSLHDNFRS